MDWKEILLNEIKESKDELKETRKEVQEHAKEVDIRLGAIEADLKYHIKRTDLLETKFKPVQKHVYGIKYLVLTFSAAVGFIITAGSLVFALDKLGLLK
ncbi:MAG: hypothetical protein GY920_20460 [Aliivibrio sp.]|nr:hypothetical protein [Aliivibrio sp.]MCP4322161.1 hypothetical protein [Alteromonadales bacterium]